MIKLEKMTPEVYYRQSRDFQYLGRLYDLILNYMKTNADLVNSCRQNSDCLQLLAVTLGFQAKHQYPNDQLQAICSSLSKILKYKGTLKSVLLLGQCLMTVEGLNESFLAEVDKDNNLSIYFPQEIDDTKLFNDLLPYILPAGQRYVIYNGTELKYETETKIETQLDINGRTYKDYEISNISCDPSAVKPEDENGTDLSVFVNSTIIEPEGD